MGSSFLSEVHYASDQEGAPVPLLASFAPTAAPGHSSAQRLSRQRFSAMAHGRLLRRSISVRFPEGYADERRLRDLFDAIAGRTRDWGAASARRAFVPLAARGRMLAISPSIHRHPGPRTAARAAGRSPIASASAHVDHPASAGAPETQKPSPAAAEWRRRAGKRHELIERVSWRRSDQARYR